jgi:hypothetical protein
MVNWGAQRRAAVRLSTEKLIPLGASAEIGAGEEMGTFAERYLLRIDLVRWVFSNFAPLNCVIDFDTRAWSGLR